MIISTGKNTTNVWWNGLTSGIRETPRESFSGIGKPEALKHALSGSCSRRITDEHRIVYRVEGDGLLIGVAFLLLRRPTNASEK